MYCSGKIVSELMDMFILHLDFSEEQYQESRWP